MSSQTVERKVVIFPSVDNDSDKEESINFNKIIIPFSNFGNSQTPAFIYHGNENIKFNKRHPVYRNLLLNEFSKI